MENWKIVSCEDADEERVDLTLVGVHGGNGTTNVYWADKDPSSPTFGMRLRDFIPLNGTCIHYIVTL